MKAMQIKIEEFDEVRTFLSNLPEDLFKKSKLIFRKTAFSIENKTKKNATDILKVRTGNLKRSIGSEVGGNSLSELNLSVYAAGKIGGQTVVYAPIQELGGVIKAKNAYKNVPGGPYLNIPGLANKTAAGVQRMSAKQVFANGGFINGRTVMRGGDDNARAFDVMFYLVKSVTIKPRLGMVDAATDEIPTMLAAFNNMDLES